MRVRFCNSTRVGLRQTDRKVMPNTMNYLMCVVLSGPIRMGRTQEIEARIVLVIYGLVRPLPK